MRKRHSMRLHPPTPGPGGRHYSENWQAWQTVQNTNLVRSGKVSFFDLGVSRKSLPLWHFLAVFRAASAANPGGTPSGMSFIATAHDSDKLTASDANSVFYHN